MFAGSDLATTVTLADSSEVKGIFLYSYAESLDYNSRMPSVLVASADVSSVSTGQTVTVGGVNYTVRAIEQGDRTTTMFLEKP